MRCWVSGGEEEEGGGEGGKEFTEEMMPRPERAKSTLGTLYGYKMAPTFFLFFFFLFLLFC